MAFIEGWPHLRGGLYEGFHCTSSESSLASQTLLLPFLSDGGRKRVWLARLIRECDSTLYVGLTRKKNGRPID